MSVEAMSLNGGAAARVIDSTFNSDNNFATVGLFRSSVARFDGANLIENEAGGPAIDVAHTSNLRVQNTTAFDIIGNVFIRNNSAANLREIDVEGDIVLQRDSNLAIRAISAVSGSVTIEDQSLLVIEGDAGSRAVQRSRFEVSPICHRLEA